MRIVLDSSATLAWIYSDEITPAIQAVFETVAEDGGLVPALWRLEVANGLTSALRRGRIDAEFRDAALRDLAMLDIATDPQTDLLAWSSILRLADAAGLTVYDAAYVELAQRRSLALASLDNPMRAAAEKLGLEVLPRP